MKIPESSFPILISELRDAQVPDMLPLPNVPIEPFTMMLTYVDNPLQVGRKIKIRDGQDEFYGTIQSVEGMSETEVYVTVRMDRKAD